MPMTISDLGFVSKPDTSMASGRPTMAGLTWKAEMPRLPLVATERAREGLSAERLVQDTFYDFVEMWEVREFNKDFAAIVGGTVDLDMSVQSAG